MASVRKRKWTTPGGEVRTAWIVDFTDGAANRDRKQFNSKAEADTFRVKMEGQLGTGTHRPDAAKVPSRRRPSSFSTIARAGWSAASA